MCIERVGSDGYIQGQYSLWFRFRKRERMRSY